MSKKGNLKHGYKAALQTQVRFGESKHKAKIAAREQCRLENKTAGKSIHGIYSTNTLKNYDKVCSRFVNWIIANHKNDVKSYYDCQKYAAEWLSEKEAEGLSAWSLGLYGSALASSFGGISKNDLGYTYPVRERKNITRNRNDNLTGEYATERQRNAYVMLKATGCRRQEMLRLRKEDFRKQYNSSGKETGYMEVFKRGKGGTERWCLVNPLYTDFVKDFLENADTFEHANEKRLFTKNDLTKNGIHSTRSIYACDLYRHFEQCGYATGELYYCRKELVGCVYDKGVLEAVSYNLQHGRNSVVITYLWLMR